MQRIMVVTDGSDGANRAVDVAADLAKAVDGSLWIVTVRNPELATNHLRQVHQLGVSEGLIERFTRQILVDAQERATRLGADKVEVHAFEGDPAQVIIEAAQREKIDVIVVGRRGRGKLPGLQLGSLAHKLTSLCRCCVMVVP